MINRAQTVICQYLCCKVKPKVEEMLLLEAELTKGNEGTSNARGYDNGANTIPDTEQPGVTGIA